MNVTIDGITNELYQLNQSAYKLDLIDYEKFKDYNDEIKLATYEHTKRGAMFELETVYMELKKYEAKLIENELGTNGKEKK